MTHTLGQPAAVRLSGIVQRFDDRNVLNGVDLEARAGVITLLGANGAGKSTLLRCIATLIAATAGTLDIDGLDPRREAERIEIRRRLGYLPQHAGFSASATVFDTLDYFGVLKELHDDRRRRHQVFEVLDRVGLADRLRDRVGNLSGGMQRRLGLAQSLLGNPTLLVLDEPSAGLDPDERQRLRSITAERRRSSTILVSTHLTDEAALGDRVLVLHQGAICFSGTPGALADVAAGRSWVQSELPPPNARASWRQPDGRHRCLGTPPSTLPPGAELVAPTIEDGYLLVTGNA